MCTRTLLPPPSCQEADWGPLTFVGDRIAGGATGDARAGTGTMGAAKGVCAGVLGSLLLISPAEAEAEPESPAVLLDVAELPVRVGCKEEGE